MKPMLCQISGVFRTPNGQLHSGATVKFRRVAGVNSYVGDSGVSVLVPDEVVIQTNPTTAVGSVNLYAGKYQVELIGSNDQRYRFLVNVPALASITFAALLESGPEASQTSDLNTILGYATQAYNSMIAAVAARDAAETSEDAVAASEAVVTAAEAVVVAAQAAAALSASGAAASAADALAKATEALGHANTATTQAGVATTQAGIATTKADEASASAAAAALFVPANYLAKSDNLSGLGSQSTARTNIGLPFTSLGIAKGRGVTQNNLVPGADSQNSLSMAVDTECVFTDVIATQSGITLPPAVSGEIGRFMIVVNNAASTAGLNVYPATGQGFEGRATNAPIFVPPGSRLLMWQRFATQWYYALVDREQYTSYFRLSAERNGGNVTTPQDLFGVGALVENGATYEYEILTSLTKSLGTGAHNFSFGFGGTAVVAGHRYVTSRSPTGVSEFRQIFGFTPQLLISGISGAPSTVNILEKGLIRVTTGGTLIPQYQLSAAPGDFYVVADTSHMRLTKLDNQGAGTRRGVWV